MSSEMTLYRAADTDTWSDCASFAETREAAEAYLSNPGFGGAKLWTTTVTVDPSSMLDLSEMDSIEAVGAICAAIGRESDPGAIGPDEFAPRVSYELREAGIEWVRVRESYPADTVTWIFVGSDDPELGLV